MRLIDERGLTPRFNEFRFDENGKVDPTYMKLVNETRQSAADTTPMVPDFNLEAAEGSFQKFVDKGGYFGGWYNNGVNVDAEAQTVASDILAGKTAKDVDYGRQDVDTEALRKSRKANRKHARFSEDFDEADTEYMNAVNSGDMETAQRMVDEAAMEIPSIAKEHKGRIQRPRYLYHGTRFFGFTQFKDSNYEVPFIYTSSDNTVSAHYAGDNHYAGIRKIGKKYEGGSSINSIIKDA